MNQIIIWCWVTKIAGPSVPGLLTLHSQGVETFLHPSRGSVSIGGNFTGAIRQCVSWSTLKPSQENGKTTKKNTYTRGSVFECCNRTDLGFSHWLMEPSVHLQIICWGPSVCQAPHSLLGLIPELHLQLWTVGDLLNLFNERIILTSGLFED